MPPHPLPVHTHGAARGVQALPLLLVFYGLPGGGPPTSERPAVDPLGDTEHDILGVCDEDRFLSPNLLDPLQGFRGCCEFHDVVGCFRRAPVAFSHRWGTPGRFFGLESDPSPSTRARVVFARSICEDGQHGFVGV